MVPKELVNYQDKLYYVYRKLKPHQVKDGYVNDIKELWGCDVVVRSKHNNDDNLLFLREIVELQIERDVI
jgi:hypothetical protein